MRVFVYEYMTAIGIGCEPGFAEHPMYREGRAMRDAVAEDFARAGYAVSVFPKDAITHAGDGWNLIIAPETDGVLANFALAAVVTERAWLGSSVEAIQLASDKLALAQHWRAHGVRTPATSDRGSTACDAFPVVWKPRDGAGSAETFLVRDRFEVAAVPDAKRPMIVQEFVPGRAASVALLCGPRGSVPLLPCFQLLSDDGRFKYEGGELPIPEELAARAVTLGRAAVECVPGLLGYVGVDLVLGDTADGSRDFAIEINPRLTTSYIGLRALADFNLAEAMLRCAMGRSIGEPAWKPGRVRFSADGAVEHE